MQSRDKDGTSCPVCGNAYDQRIVVERGDRWADVFGGPPFSALGRYQRWCSSRYDAEDDRERGESERVVYFHDDGPAR